MRIRRLLILGVATILGIPLALIGLLIAIVMTRALVLGSMGYIIDDDNLAEHIVENNESPERCLLLQFSIPDISQTLSQMRQSCLMHVARATGNLRACTLLLPDDYALYCIGIIEEKLSSDFGCGAAQKDTINCAPNKHIPYQGIAFCTQYSDEDAREWCHAERTATLPGIHECDKISRDQVPYREECELRYAFKLKDRKHCAVITDQKRKELCEVKIDVELTYGDQWRYEEEHRPSYILRVASGSTVPSPP